MKSIFHISYLVIAVLLLVGCIEKKAQVDNPKSYSKEGVTFEYPRNWKVTEDTQQEGPRNIFVESPGSAILSIQIYTTDEVIEIQKFAKSFSAYAQEEKSVDGIDAPVFSGVDKSSGDEVVTEQFSLILLGKKTPHTRIYQIKIAGNKKCFLIAQVADSNMDKVIKGFEQIFSSFKCETSN